MSLRGGLALAAALAVAALAGCATIPPPALQPDEDEEPMLLNAPPPPMIEYPPIEPVEPPAPATEPAPAARTPEPPPTEAPAAPPQAPVAPPELPPEAVEILALLADLQRFGAMSPDDVRRELAVATQALARQRTDANRVRLAVLYTLLKNPPQDDQRALQLLDNVAKGPPGSPAVKQVAAVLQAQITERLRAVRDEQVKADAAIQKLEALRAMERSLLRDRIRSGGGGAGGGGGGTGSGSSGGGGAGGGGAGGGGR